MKEILLGKSDQPVYLHAKYGNRRGIRRSEAAGAVPAGGVSSTSEAKPVQPNPLHDFILGTKRRQGMVETMAKQAAQSVGGKIGNQIVCGLLGGITRSR